MRRFLVRRIFIVFIILIAVSIIIFIVARAYLSAFGHRANTPCSVKKGRLAGPTRGSAIKLDHASTTTNARSASIRR